MSSTHEFISSPEGRKALSWNAEANNIELILEPFTSVNIFDLDCFEQPPVGYESSDDVYTRYTDRNLKIMYKHSHSMESLTNRVTIKSIYIMHHDSNVSIQVLDSTESRNIIDPNQIFENVLTHTCNKIEFQIRYIIKESFEEAFANTIVIEFESFAQHNVCFKESRTWICAVPIKGIVKHKQQMLSVEAKPFVSRHMREFFDVPCPPLFPFQIHANMIQPPQRFDLILHYFKYLEARPPSYHASYANAVVDGKFKSIFASMVKKLPRHKTEALKYISLLKE
jgi:hypothetical protein